jgi:hypothetical protein
VSGSVISAGLPTSPLGTDCIIVPRDAWRAVSEGSSAEAPTSLLIVCTGRIFTDRLSPIGTAGYSEFPAYSQVLREPLDPRGLRSNLRTVHVVTRRRLAPVTGMVVSAMLCMSPCRSDWIINATLHTRQSTVVAALSGVQSLRVLELSRAFPADCPHRTDCHCC